MPEQSDTNAPLNIIVIGASGDLARKKVFPALFALFSQGLLPENTRFFGFARTDMSDEKFREKIMENLICRYTPDHSCASFVEKFLERCFYCQGNYGSADSYMDLYCLMRDNNNVNNSNLLFYLAIPPTIFVEVVEAIGQAGLVRCDSRNPWSRVVIEKPFGKDRESSDILNKELAQVFIEEETYRIDHYLGKEVVQNLLVMRFANQIFQPLWNSQYIEKVDIIWEENIGTGGRGGYFDNYGIIRDVIQNHLLQVLALIAMEEPASLSAKDIRDGKVEVLKAVPPIALGEVVLGQYTAYPEKNELAYTDDPTVPDDSLSPTFAEVTLSVNNDRWRGVPFTIRAGKALKNRKAEIRILFKTPPRNIFCSLDECPPPNEMVIRIQPDEGMHFKIVNKIPGLKMGFKAKDLDLSYESAFADTVIPEAYESLLIDVINGEKSLFIRNDELEAAWDIFTPVLHEIEAKKIKPKPYPFGSDGPVFETVQDCGCGCGGKKRHGSERN